MKEFLYKIKPFLKIFTLICILTIIGFSAYFYKLETDKKENNEILVSTLTTNDLEKEEENWNNEEERISFIYVDVKGAVKKPGVYKLEEGSRVIDAINKSGGLSKDADTSVINLSKKLVDGNVIVVYTTNYIEERKKQEVIIEYIEKDCICPDSSNDACINDNDVVVDNPENKDNNASENIGKVSLNTATKEELMSLPGVGESKANDILNYINENGKFKRVEDIKNVKGIGEALFEKIKEFITI